MRLFSKQDIICSLILGEGSCWFLIFVIRNPYIEEFKQLIFLKDIIWWLSIIFPIIFLSGILLAKFLSRTIKAIYQFIKFIEVGILSTAIDFGILNLLIWITGITGGLIIAPLNATPFLVSSTNSYFLNKSWTFQSKESAWGKKFPKFLIISGIGLGINTGIVVLGTSLISPLLGLSSGAWVNLMKVLATSVSMTWNFLGYKFWVFNI